MNVGVMRFLKEVGTFLRKGSFAFVGDSEFFKEEAQRVLLKTLRKQSSLDEDVFNPQNKTEDTSGKKQSVIWERIEECLAEPPMTGHYRMVLIKNADVIKNISKMGPYLKDPSNDHKILVSFTEKAEKKVYEEQLVFDCVVVCDEMGVDTKEFDKFVSYCLQTSGGKELTPDARELVKRVFAKNLGWMQSEITKVSLFVGDSPEISVDDLRRALASYSVAEVFDLIDIVLERNTGQALRLVGELIEKGVDVTFLTYLIMQRLQVILAAIKAQRQGEKLKDFMIRRKVPLFQYNQIWNGMKSLREVHLGNMFEILAWTEYYARKGKDPQLIGEIMVTNLCGGRLGLNGFGL